MFVVLRESQIEKNSTLYGYKKTWTLLGHYYYLTCGLGHRYTLRLGSLMPPLWDTRAQRRVTTFPIQGHRTQQACNRITYLCHHHHVTTSTTSLTWRSSHTCDSSCYQNSVFGICIAAAIKKIRKRT